MMNIGEAVQAMRAGAKVARSGWNGKGMFLYFVAPGNYPAASPVAKAHWGDDALVPYTAYIAIKSVNETVTPWVCSQTDLLADDWQVVN